MLPPAMEGHACLPHHQLSLQFVRWRLLLPILIERSPIFGALPLRTAPGEQAKRGRRPSKAIMEGCHPVPKVPTARPIDAAPRRLSGMGPKKAPKTTMFWVTVLTLGVVAWIALEFANRALS